MWIGKFRIKHECPILEKTKKYKVTSSGFVLNVYEENNEKFHSILHVVKGEKKERDKYLRSFKKDKTVSKMQVHNNQLFAIIKGEMIAQRYSKKLFYLAPIVHKGDSEVWTLGSYTKRELSRFYEKVKEIGSIKVLQMQRINPPIFIQSIVPKLTLKQQEAFDYAREFGYYESPRKISIKELARRLKTPRSTFQSHLRKAEQKILGNNVLM